MTKTAIPGQRQRPPDERDGADKTPLSWREGIRVGVRTVGELCITVGIVLLLFAAYEVWGKALIVNEHQQDLDAALTREWSTPHPETRPGATPAPALPPPPGGSIARLYLPRLNKHWVVVEGVAAWSIAYAPGHYPDSAMPGAIGNFAMAGHRSPAVFWYLDRMRVGDPIVVETRSTFFVYHVTEAKIVSPQAVEVVAPVPGEPWAKPRRAMLTITTCNPRWDNYQRLIVHAALHHKQSRAQGPPTEIGTN